MDNLEAETPKGSMYKLLFEDRYNKITKATISKALKYVLECETGMMCYLPKSEKTEDLENWEQVDEKWLENKVKK